MGLWEVILKDGENSRNDLVHLQDLQKSIGVMYFLVMFSANTLSVIFYVVSGAKNLLIPILKVSILDISSASSVWIIHTAKGSPIYPR